MSLRSVWALAVVFGAAACKGSDEQASKRDAPRATAVSSDPSASTSTLASGEGADDENTAADSPTQVSGAWIVDCEPLGEDIPFIKPSDGEEIAGCTVLDNATGKPANIEPGTLEITLAASDGTAVQPEAIAPPDGSKYHFFVTVTEKQLRQLIIAAISFIDALEKARQNYSNEDLKNEPVNIPGKIVWDMFGDKVNEIDVPTQPLVPLPEDGKHTIFVSHKVYLPDFGGLEGADAICAEAGKEVDASKAWIALLSTSTVDARDRVEITGPVYNVMAELVAKDAAELWGATATVQHGRVAWTERGFDTQGYVVPLLKLEIAMVWTGSTSDGRYASSIGSCADWTTKEFDSRATCGSSSKKSGDWFGETRDVSCSFRARVYCISR